MIGTTSKVRLASLVAAACLVAVAGAFPARAQSPSALLDEARVKASRLKSSYERLAKDYAEQQERLGHTEQSMLRTRRDIARGMAQTAALESHLRKRVQSAYRVGGLGLVQMLLDGPSFRDFSQRFIAVQRKSESDQALMSQLRRNRAELEAKQRQLKEARLIAARQTAALKSHTRELSASFAQAQELVQHVMGRLKPSEIAQLFRMGGSVGGGVVIPLDFCPVSGPHYVVDDFGAPRDGGIREHQGNDIMAPMGTPIVAPVAGTISLLQSGGKGGLAIYMTGVGNVEFYFAHESEISAREGQEVAAGQEIGRVGDTGNAEGGAPHLHFEIHPDKGPAIDPYASLMAVC